MVKVYGSSLDMSVVNSLTLVVCAVPRKSGDKVHPEVTDAYPKPSYVGVGQVAV